MVRPMRTLLLALGLLLAHAAGASAASLSVFWSPASATMGVTYDDWRGEVNHLLVTPDGANVLIVDDAVAVTAPTPRPGDPATCTQEDPHTVRCPSLGIVTVGVHATLGGGDDTADVRSVNGTGQSTIDGGPGNDTVIADAGSLRGGPGDDTLTLRYGDWNQVEGGDGDDHLFGGTRVDLLIGGPGRDVLDGRAGNDTLHDGAAADPDGEDDVLLGGPGVDALYSHGGVDRLEGGDDLDYLYARDGETAPGSPSAGTPDVVDCGAGDDVFHADPVDALVACEQAWNPCTSPPYPGRPAPPCPAAGGGGGGGPGAGAGASPPPPASSTAPPPAAPPRPAAAPPPLEVRLRLDAARGRLPLRPIPRGLVTLSATAHVTITLERRTDGPFVDAAGSPARRSAGSYVELPGSINRRLGAGERSISLAPLLNSRRGLIAGRYRITLAAQAADGRTATAHAALRLLARAKAKPRKPTQRRPAASKRRSNRPNAAG